MSGWKFKLVGHFAAYAPNGTQVQFPGRKHEALIAYTLLSRTGTTSRDSILNLLWGSRSEKQARDSLRNVLYQIDRTCKPYEKSPIEKDRFNIFVDKQNCSVDVWTLNDVMQNKIEYHTGIFSAKDELLSSLKIKEDSFEDWISAERDSFNSLARRIQSKQLQRLLKYRNFEQSEIVANQILVRDNTDEEAHRALMQVYFEQGKNSLALKQYEHCKKIVAQTLDSNPSTETYELANFIRAKSTKESEARPYTLPLSSSHKNVTDTDKLPTFSVIAFDSIDEYEDISTSLLEDIVGACSKFRWFIVSPAHSKLAHLSNNIDSSQSPSLHNTAYQLVGKLRVQNDNVSLLLELIETRTPSSIWIHSITIKGEGHTNIEDIPPLVASSIDKKIKANEIRNVYALPESSLGAYECALRAVSSLYDLNGPNTYRDTERLFKSAVTQNPQISWFYSLWSLWKMYCLGQDWVENPKNEFELAGFYARQAIKRDPEDALAHAINGHFVSFWHKRLSEGRLSLDKSLELNPYSSFSLIYSAVNYAYSGKPKEALTELNKIKRLDGVEHHFEFMYHSAHCITHLINKDPEQAVKWGFATIHENPGFTNGYKQLLVALGHLGDKNACKTYFEALVELQPDFNSEEFVKQYPLTRDEDKLYFLDGLEKAKLLSE